MFNNVNLIWELLSWTAPEPEVANLYSTKSGSKRIFQSAGVAMPFGEFDIYNKDQVCGQIQIQKNMRNFGG